MVVVVLLAAIWLLKMQTVGKKETEITDNSATTKEPEVNIKIITTIDADEFKDVGAQGAQINSKLSNELCDLLKKLKMPSLSKDQLVDTKFAIKDPDYRIEKKDVDLVRESWLKFKSIAESELKKPRDMMLQELTIDKLDNKIPDGSDFKISRDVASALKAILEKAKPSYTHARKRLPEEGAGSDVIIKFEIDKSQNELISEINKLSVDAAIKVKCVCAILTASIPVDDTKAKLPPRFFNETLSEIIDSNDAYNSEMIARKFLYEAIAKKFNANSKKKCVDEIDDYIKNFEAAEKNGRNDEEKKRGKDKKEKAENIKAHYLGFINALEKWSPK
jgi:hypothetical protein